MARMRVRLTYPTELIQQPIVICITGNGLKTPDVLYDRLSVDVTIRPSLAVFDQALADLKSKTGG